MLLLKIVTSSGIVNAFCVVTTPRFVAKGKLCIWGKILMNVHRAWFDKYAPEPLFRWLFDHQSAFIRWIVHLWYSWANWGTFVKIVWSLDEITMSDLYLAVSLVDFKLENFRIVQYGRPVGRLILVTFAGANIEALCSIAQ